MIFLKSQLMPHNINNFNFDKKIMITDIQHVN